VWGWPGWLHLGLTVFLAGVVSMRRFRKPHLMLACVTALFGSCGALVAVAFDAMEIHRHPFVFLAISRLALVVAGVSIVELAIREKNVRLRLSSV
jgi:hypothetical protein